MGRAQRSAVARPLDSRRRDIAETLFTQAQKTLQLAMGRFQAKFGENIADQNAMAKMSIGDATRLFTESAKEVNL